MATRRKFLSSASASALLAPLSIARTATDSVVPDLPDPGEPGYWDKIRNQFLLAPDKVFFNNGTIGAMPRVVFERVVGHLRQMAVDVADWDYRGADWIAGYMPLKEIRAKVGRVLNADLPEVALTENVTSAMSYVAAGLDLEPGSEVLTTDQEHPGGRSSWLVAAKRRKVTVKEVRIPKPAHSPDEILDLFRKAITSRTRVIAISHVITGSGAILPVKAICAEARARGILTALDGAQAVGHIGVDVKDIGCDAYVGCLHKWLLAPAGTGFLYLRKQRAREVWTTLANSAWDEHDDEGYRFTQRGTGSLSLIMGMDAALDFYFAIGPERIQQRIKFLGDSLREGLRRIPKVRIFSPEDPAMCAGITVYNIEGFTGARLQDEFWTRDRLRPRAQGDVYGVRHCTHIFNSPGEIERALRVVRDLARG